VRFLTAPVAPLLKVEVSPVNTGGLFAIGLCQRRRFALRTRQDRVSTPVTTPGRGSLLPVQRLGGNAGCQS
jgi:hypothetical protein